MEQSGIPTTRPALIFLLIPTALSLSRLLLGIAFPFLPSTWRLPTLVYASLSDMLDGSSARYFHTDSHTGRVLDPIADKVFILAVVLTLLEEGLLGPGEIVLVGLRDLAVFIGIICGVVFRTWTAFREMKPTYLAKTTTAAQLTLILVLLSAPTWKEFALYPTVLLSALSAVQYLRIFARLHAESDVERSSSNRGTGTRASMVEEKLQ